MKKTIQKETFLKREIKRKKVKAEDLHLAVDFNSSKNFTDLGNGAKICNDFYYGDAETLESVTQANIKDEHLDDLEEELTSKIKLDK